MAITSKHSNHNPTGYGVYTDSWGVQIEYDTASCRHCTAVIFLKPGTGGTVYFVVDRAQNRFVEVPGAFCLPCMSPICLRCHAADKGTCAAWERKFAIAESRERFVQQCGVRG